METNTFGAFIWNNIIKIVRNRRICLVRRDDSAICQLVIACHGVAIRDAPLNAAFINRIIRTFWLTRTTIDALVRNHDCHIAKKLIDEQ
jgi:hypothetical protein